MDILLSGNKSKGNLLCFRKIVRSCCDFKRCAFNAWHILIVLTIKHSFDGQFIIYRFESEFTSGINVLVKKKKNPLLLVRAGWRLCPLAVQRAGSHRCWGGASRRGALAAEAPQCQCAGWEEHTGRNRGDFLLPKCFHGLPVFHSFLFSPRPHFLIFAP